MINPAHKCCPHSCKIKLILALAVILTLATGAYSGANDAAVEVTTGGLVLRQEERISIEKETLYISVNKIEVSYEFRNNSDKDVATEVAFPVPDYTYEPEHPLSRVASFRDFRVYVDGRETPYRKEARAFLNGKDYSGILKEMQITIDDFGGFETGDSTQVFKLNESDQNRLVKLGLLHERERWPLWAVKTQFHWTQTFPARKSVTIRHTYAPYWGFQSFAFGRSWADDRKWGEKAPDHDRVALIKNACIDKELEKKIAEGAFPEGRILGSWISYILITANTWKKPIKLFHLIVEKEESDHVSFCFPTQMKKTGENRYETAVKNFIPKNDLKIYFLRNEKFSK